MMDDRGWWFGRIFLLVLAQNCVNFAQCRPVLAKEDGTFVDVGPLTKDSKFTHVLPLGLLVTIATLVSLMIVLFLCTCAEKPQRSNEAAHGSDNEAVKVEDNGDLVSPSPDTATVPNPDVTLTIPLNDAPKERTCSIQSTGSNSGLQDEALVRSATVERRLPELPPTPMAPVTPTNEEEEDDYNRTYDVIGETKADVRAFPGNKDDGKKVEGEADEIEDDQYACVSDSAANAQVCRPKSYVTEDTDYNTIGGNGPEGNMEEGDEAYASVVVGDAKEPNAGSYASVSNKDEKEGYARLRSIQKQRSQGKPSDGSEKNGYARLRDVTLEGGAVGGAVGGVNEDNEQVPPVPYKPPDLQNEDEEEQDATVPRTSSTGAAAAAAGVSAMGSNEGQSQAPAQKREPPYTQVSARESLEVVRARQQAEQNARLAAHYQSIEEDQNLDIDHDGIYEPVDDQQLDNHLVMSLPPLPSDRQGSISEPCASNNWQMTRAPRVYEEITEETRPKPPNVATAASSRPAGTDNDDIQPYAVTENRRIPGDAPSFTLDDKNSKANYAKVNKANKGSDQANNNAMTEAKPPDLASPPVTEDGLPLYAVVDKKGKGRGSRAFLRDDIGPTSDRTSSADLPEDNYQTVEDNYQSMDDNYQSVGDMPSNADPSAAAIAGGMVHVSEHTTRSDLWTKKEHMYIDVETNETSQPTETNHNASEGQRGQHSYETVELAPKALSKKEKQKQAKKAKKEAKRERKSSKGSKGTKDKGESHKSSGNGEAVWRRQDSAEGNGNSNNNTETFDDYENVAFPLHETRL